MYNRKFEIIKIMVPVVHHQQLNILNQAKYLDSPPIDDFGRCIIVLSNQKLQNENLC